MMTLIDRMYFLQVRHPLKYIKPEDTVRLSMHRPQLECTNNSPAAIEHSKADNMTVMQSGAMRE